MSDTSNISGVVNVLKPPGMSSHNVVSALRKLFDQKKVGHTGTLDPGAAGVLPICVGKATRLSEYLIEKEKTYYAHIIFGRSTDTYDSFGETIDSSEKIVNIEDLNKVIPDFLGDIVQAIPAYSAKKVGGQKLYDLARKGNAINNITKNVTVYSLNILNELRPNAFLLKISCSKGTYIRSICHEIGIKLGVPSHMGVLIRTKSGNFKIENAVTIDELKDMKEKGCLTAAVASMEEVLYDYPSIYVNDDYKSYVMNGRKIPIEKAKIDQDHLGKNVYICFCENEFYGIAGINDGLIKLVKLLNVGMR